MKLELSFGSFKDLKEQLQTMIDELGGTETNQLPLPINTVYVGEVPKWEPPVEKVEEVKLTEEDMSSLIKSQEQPKKRTRRTKEQIEAEKNKPVETAPVVEQPTLPEVVAPVVEATPELETPKNFYSPSEFVANFVIIINNLLNNGSLGIGDIEAACKYYDVKLIYMVGKDLAMCEHFYNDLVSRQIITKKGDY